LGGAPRGDGEEKERESADEDLLLYVLDMIEGLIISKGDLS
jgi:hypothetical protein